MHSISVLVTIAAAVNSENPEIRKQIPEKFHRSQTIVLCPSAMVPNWGDEFAMWTPRDVLSFLGPIRLVVARNTYKGVDERMVNISAWMKDGGVLVMSYEMFRQFVMNTSTRTGSAREWLSDEEHRMLREALLDGPNIVVADEAHKIKNEKSAISQAAAGFKTMSRIALTGSPLANNLLEYFQMVDWVAPGYLESLSKFKEKFLEPIQSGSYLDSSPQQQRESLCALKILDGILQPKVLRADTSVIEGDLPPKTEYLIQVPLTKIQEEAYNLFVSQVQRGESHINRALYSWLALLQLCCNHPYPFREKLNNRIQAAEDAESHLPHAMEDAQLPTTLVSDLDVLFDKIDRLSAKDHSHRVRVLIKIIKKSKEAGDKVLVFTQSIPTMNYIEQVLKEYKCGFQRIDGAVPGINRQAATKSFNTDPKQHVLLISTKAGGLGLNMFGANRVVIFDFQFNPVHEEQAVGRAYRLGQTKPVFVYRFISAGTYEDSLFNKAQYKRQLAVRVVDKKTPAPEARKENRTLLHPVKNVVRGNFNGIQGTDPLVLDMILDKLIRNGSIVNVSFSHIRDDEKGNLTEAEKRHVANQLMLERLKRDDPQKYAAEMKKREDALKQMSQQQMALLQGTSAVVSQHLSGGPALPPALQELGMFRGTSALVSQPHAGGPPLPLTLAQNPPHSSSPSRPPALARYMPSSIPLAASSSATGGVVGYTPSSFFLQQTHASVDLEHQSGRQPGPLPPVHTAGDSARAPNSPIPVIDLTSSGMLPLTISVTPHSVMLTGHISVQLPDIFDDPAACNW
ncbi:hypothetical protein N7532_006792 [Penicillium argentinense]|uniref:Uncharacterized protein n=1 Tax=Penicillium argentinense TaxID=1131581 RepID=A0A9W9FGL2_9EURO|nr:uncharacterized protein N7532_006792 [Penicillium argentinense]KAJ5099791.1 hypothetical protein N7532_006792 [Penicillium argentinense]